MPGGTSGSKCSNGVKVISKPPLHSSALGDSKERTSLRSHLSQMLVPETYVPGSLRPKELGFPYAWVKLFQCYPGHCAGVSDIRTGISQGSAWPCSLAGHAVGAHLPKCSLGCESPGYKSFHLELYRKDISSQGAVCSLPQCSFHPLATSVWSFSSPPGKCVRKLFKESSHLMQRSSP